MLRQPLPQLPQLAHGAAIQNRFPPEFDANARDIRQQAILERDDTFKPAEQFKGGFDIRRDPAELDQRLAVFVKFMDDEHCTIGDDANIVLTGDSLPILEISDKLRLKSFLAQVRFQLNDRAAKQGIYPATDFKCLMFERNITRRSTQAIGQQLEQQASDLFMAGTGQKLADDFLKNFIQQHYGPSRFAIDSVVRRRLKQFLSISFPPLTHTAPNPPPHKAIPRRRAFRGLGLPCLAVSILPV